MAAAEQASARRRPPFSRIDGFFGRFHGHFIKRYPALSLAIGTALYAAVVLVLGRRLAVSSNYFIIIPVLSAALAYGLPGGIAAGFLGLPANLLLFALIGHPEFSPASKPIAELSGIVVGTASGYLAEYFSKLEAEIETRIATEEALRQALSEKELLLQELNHRVKNNLNVIKSLAQLQRNRSSDPDFLEAVDDLVGRIFSISLVHEQLHGSYTDPWLEVGNYLQALLANIVSAFPERDPSVSITCSTSRPGMRISSDLATPLGLIVNEVTTNALRHAFTETVDGTRPAIQVELLEEGEDYLLRIEDNGRGIGSVDVAGLGSKIVRALCGQMRGSMKLEPIARCGFAAPGGADGANAICGNSRNGGEAAFSRNDAEGKAFRDAGAGEAAFSRNDAEGKAFRDAGGGEAAPCEGTRFELRFNPRA